MNVLLIAAHGSRVDDSNREVAALARSVSDRLGTRFDAVLHGFLELAEPSISAALDAAAERGATRVAVLPYFLAAGRHVKDDIPDIVSRKRRQWPDMRIEVLDYVGISPKMSMLLAELATTPRPRTGSGS